MGDEYFKAEQGRISALEADAKKSEKAKTLDQKLSEQHDAFFGTVDDARKQIVDAEKVLSEHAEYRNYLIVEKGNIDTFLKRAADKGRDIYAKENAGKEADKSLYKTIDESATSLRTRSKEIKEDVPFFLAVDQCDSIYKSKAGPTLKKVAEIQDKDGFASKDLLPSAEEAINQLAAAKRALSGQEQGAGFSRNKESYDAALEPVNAKLEEMGKIKLYYETKKFCETVGAPEVERATEEIGMGEYGNTRRTVLNKGQEVYLKFDEATGDVTPTDAFKRLPESKQMEMINQLHLLRKKNADDIDERCLDPEKDKDLKSFYEGKKKLADGDWIGAKTGLLGFYNAQMAETGRFEKDDPRMAECMELLKQIAKLELAQMRQRYELIRKTVDTQYANITSPTGQHDYGTSNMNAVLVLDRVEKVLDQAEKDIEGGKYLTVTNLINDKNLINSNMFVVSNPGEMVRMTNFNVFYQQEILNDTDPVRRQKKLQEMAVQARKDGLTDLAKHYYEMSFQTEISAAAKTISREKIQYNLARNPKIQEEITTRYESWKKNFKDRYYEEYKSRFLKAHPNDEPKTQDEMSAEADAAYESERPTARGKIFNSMVDEKFNAAVKKKVHYEMKGRDDDKAKLWKDAYDNTLLNLENIEGDEALFTDEEWNKFKVMVFVDIAILIASGGVAGAVTDVLVGSALRTALTEAVGSAALEAAMRQGGARFAAFVIETLGPEKALAYGISNLAVESFTFNAVNGGLNAVVKNDPSTFASPEAFLKSWGHNAITLGACKAGGLGYSFKARPKTIPGMVAHEIGAVAADTLAMTVAGVSLQSLSGDDLTKAELLKMVRDGVIFSVGLKGAHGLIGHGGGEEAREGTTKEEQKSADAVKKYVDADTKATKAREAADAAKKSGAKNAGLLEGVAVELERTARAADSEAKQARAKEQDVRVADMQKTIDAMKKSLEKKDLPQAERERIELLVKEFDKIKADGGDLRNAEKALFEEHRFVEIDDPENPGKKKKIDLFEHYSSKNFAYSKEMVDLMNDYGRLLKEGPKIIKHGGDEIVILHAGPDGKVQMFFGDVGNMGPTNEFALRLKGNDANMVDLYLSEFSQIVKTRFQPGKAVDGNGLLAEIAKNLSKKYFGIETEAEFNKLQKQWGLDGDWETYKQNMGNARILAGFRTGGRNLQKEFADSVGDRPADPARDNKEFSDFIAKKIQGLDTGTPSLTEILKKNLSALKTAHALDDLFPQGSDFNGVGSMNPAELQKILAKTERTAEENMLIYFALQRVNVDKIGTLEGLDASGVQGARDRFGKLRQSSPEGTLMDFQMAGIDIPKFNNRDFNTTDMKFFLDRVLEDGLHAAKGQKGEREIVYTENPFDGNGNIRANHPKAKEYAKDYEKAAQDKKAEVIAQTQKLIDQGEQKLDAFTKQMRKLLDKTPLTKEDIQSLAELRKQYDAVVEQINSAKYKDAETGADRPGRFAQDMDAWMRGRDGVPIDKQYQMYREFVLDMHNTGAINGQKGYAATDAAMKKIAEFMTAKFPGAASIIRTGGGAFKLVFLDVRQLPHVNGQPISVLEHQALIRAALTELNPEVQKIIAADTKTVVDGSVRDATEAFRKRGGRPTPVGEVELLGSFDLQPAQFGAERDKITAPRSLYKIVDPRRITSAPAQGPAAMHIPGEDLPMAAE